MNRRHFLSSLASFSALAALPWLYGCQPKQPLKVGIHTWIGYETLNLAQEFHWLPEEIQLHENQNISISSALIQSGELDAACLTLDEVLRLRSLGVPLTVVLVFDVSAGADAVIARHAIQTLADLSGKRIGVEHNALGILVLHELLEAAKLPLSAVKIVDCPTEHQLSAWRNNEIDALITFEPTPTILQRDDAHRIFDSRQFPDTIFDVLAVRTDHIGNDQSALDALLDAHFKGLNHLQANRQDAIYRIANREKISADEVQQAYAGILLPSLPANREYLNAANGRLIETVKKVSALMVQHGLMKQTDTLQNLVSADWLPHGEN